MRFADLRSVDANALGHQLQNAGDLNGALEAFRRAAAGGDVDALVSVGCVLQDLGDTAGAKDAFAHASKRGSSMGTTNLGVLHWIEGDLEVARHLLTEATDAGNPLAAQNLAGVLHQLGDDEAAFEAFKRGDELGDAMAAYNHGVILYERGCEHEAEQAWRRAEERGEPGGAMKLGMLYSQRGDESAGEAALERMGELMWAQRRRDEWWRTTPYRDMTVEQRRLAEAAREAWAIDLKDRQDAVLRGETDPLEPYAVLAEGQDMTRLLRTWHADSAVLRDAAFDEVELARAHLVDTAVDGAVVISDVTYLGGTAGDDARSDVNLAFAPPIALAVSDKHGDLISRIRWDDILDLTVEGSDQIRERVTATRIVALGPLAWAFKKREDVAYLVLRTTSGDRFYECPLSTHALKARLAPIVEWINPVSNSPAPAESLTAPDQGNVVTQLKALRELLDDGTLTQAEFEREKHRLLA